MRWKQKIARILILLSKHIKRNFNNDDQPPSLFL